MSSPSAEPSPTWRDRAEVTGARLWLFGSVLPRAVTSSVAAARRDGSSGIPAWDLGLRAFGETATDELFIALSACYRTVPHLDVVRAHVDRCAEVVDGLEGRGVADAHHRPGPLATLGLRRRGLGPLRYEHLEYESRPRLPEVLARSGHGQAEVAHARLLRHPGEERPWVVWLHGAEQGRLDDLLAFRARHLHEGLGLNVAFPVLPQHGPRRELGRAWPGFDPLDNVATMMRAVSDVRALLGWLAEQGVPTVSLVGMSLGGPVAALTAGLDDRVDGVCAVVPMLDAHATIAHHTARTGPRGRTLAALLREPPVRRLGALVDPTELEPVAPRHRRLVVAALNDRMTSVRAAQRLHQRWQGEVHWHHGGHIGHLLSGRVRATVDRFLAAAAPAG